MRMSPVVLWSRLWVAVIASTIAGCAAGCIDNPPDPSGEVVARLVAAWDPLACGEPHRVVVELEDATGAMISVSAPCNLGGVTVDVPHQGMYSGRIYAWSLDAPIRSVMPISIAIEMSIVHWFVSTPL